MNEEISLQFVKFPNNFTFTKTPDGFKVNCTSGEFFPNKNKTTIFFITFAIVILSLLSMMYFMINADKNETYIPIGIGCFLFGCLSIPLFIFISHLTDIKAEYTISPKGINVASEKGNIFIPKSNIKNINIQEQLYTSNSSRTHRSYSYYYYVVYIELTKPINNQYTNINMDKIALFSDYMFKEEKTARFILQEFNKIIDSNEMEINEMNNLLEDMEEEEKTISINDIEIPKDLNYKETDDGFSVTSGDTNLFPHNNLFIFIGIIVSYLLLFISYPIVIPLISSYAKSHFSEFISIIITIVYCFGTFIGVMVFFIIYSKVTTIIGNFKISPNGINITCKKGTMSIPKDIIANVYIEKEEVQTASNGSYILVPHYEIFLDFQEAQYIPFINSKVEKAHLFGKVTDKRVANFFVQEIKKILNL